MKKKHAKKSKPEEIKIPLVIEGKKFILVKYSANYADEFDVYGWKVFDTIEWEQWKSNIENNFKRFEGEFYFGTNESILYQDKQSILDDLKITNLSTKETKVLFDLFGSEGARYLDFDGKNYNKIVYFTECIFGIFPDIFGKNKEELPNF